VALTGRACPSFRPSARGGRAGDDETEERSQARQVGCVRVHTCPRTTPSARRAPFLEDFRRPSFLCARPPLGFDPDTPRATPFDSIRRAPKLRPDVASYGQRPPAANQEERRARDEKFVAEQASKRRERDERVAKENAANAKKNAAIEKAAKAKALKEQKAKDAAKQAKRARKDALKKKMAPKPALKAKKVKVVALKPKPKPKVRFRSRWAAPERPRSRGKRCLLLS
jgi:hypothetical protein